MLGDNFFYGGNFSGHLADCQKSKNKFKLFTYNVKNPDQFGVLTNKQNNYFIREKPKTILATNCNWTLFFTKQSNSHK